MARGRQLPEKSDWELLFKRMEDGRWMAELVYRRDTVWIGDADSKADLREKARQARVDLAFEREELPEDNDYYDERPGMWD